jgi:anti-sigma factor RsiW
MKPCRRNRKRITWLAVDALDAAEAQKLREHIETCDECRCYFEAMTRLAERVESAQPGPEPGFSQRLHRRVLGALRSRQQRAGILSGLMNRMQPGWRFGLIGATAIAVAIVALLALQRPSHSVPVRPEHPQTTRPEVAGVDVDPTVANYRIAANHSFEQMDRLLQREANRTSASGRPYRASDSAVGSLAD